MKKNCFFINGNACTGKTTTAQRLMKKLPNCAWVDGDWCLKMNPNIFSDETKALRYSNCCLLINNLIRSPLIENIVFCRAVDDQKYVDFILSQLDLRNVDLYYVILTVNEKVYRRRFKRAIRRGERPKFCVKVINGERVCEENFAYYSAQTQQYEQLNGIKIDTSDLTIEQVVEKIKQLPEQVAPTNAFST